MSSANESLKTLVRAWLHGPGRAVPSLDQGFVSSVSHCPGVGPGQHRDALQLVWVRRRAGARNDFPFGPVPVLDERAGMVQRRAEADRPHVRCRVRRDGQETDVQAGAGGGWLVPGRAVPRLDQGSSVGVERRSVR